MLEISINRKRPVKQLYNPFKGRFKHVNDMTNVQKSEILQLIEDEKERLGSYRAVATKCKLSEATISQLRKGTYAAEGDGVYDTIAKALGYTFDVEKWYITETKNFRDIIQVLEDAKSKRMFMAISSNAGSGKTAATEYYHSENKKNRVFKLNCKEWTARACLEDITNQIGLELPKEYTSIPKRIVNISNFFRKIADKKPLLIIDQANSLHFSALKTLIHIENETNRYGRVLGIVLLGTENLESQIKRGIRLNKDGCDELESRFGRNYIHLRGADLNDVRIICNENGITDKDLQKQIYIECAKSRVTLPNGMQISVVEDMRRLERVINREKFNRHES